MINALPQLAGHGLVEGRAFLGLGQAPCFGMNHIRLDGTGPLRGTSSGEAQPRTGRGLGMSWHEQVVPGVLVQHHCWTLLGEKHSAQQKMISAKVQNREIFHPNFTDARSALVWHLESSIIEAVLN